MTVLAILLLGITSWLLRVAFIAFIPAERLPESLRDGLEYLAPAVLAALITVELLGASRGLEPPALAVILGTMILSGVAARLTGSLALAVAIGATGAVIVDLLLL